ncbi:hypothetical protein B0H13DRAFT_2314835 [Mycena leptocephala]|nr:hypothetical protein B0H13DRAFT_2314835 [Mycena leptocephala]
MVHLANITTILAAAAGIIVVDFQNHAIENTFGLSLVLNPLVADVRGATAFQQWTFFATTTPGIFTLQSTSTPSSSGLFLSYPAEPPSGPLQFAQAVLNKIPIPILVETINPALNTVMLIEQVTGTQALTSWAAESGSNWSPVTWEENSGRAQQIFTLVAA